MATVISGDTGIDKVQSSANPDNYPADALDDSWNYTRSTALNITSNTTFDWNVPTHIGSNISESSGVFTVTNSGLYMISCRMVNNSTSNTTASFKLRINNVDVNSTRLYWASASEVAYLGASSCWTFPLNAGDNVRMYGLGYIRGSNDMVNFSGAKIGEL